MSKFSKCQAPPSNYDMFHKILNMLPESLETMTAVWRNGELMTVDAL